MTNKFVEKSEFINTDFDKLDSAITQPIFGVQPHLAVLAQAVIAKYPQWQLVAVSAQQYCSDTSVVPNVTGRLVTKFNIVEKREELGYISWDYSYSRGDQYVIGNDRISEQMERTSHTKTTKIDVAMRHIKKHFSPKTVDEHFAKSVAEASQGVYKQVQNLNYAVRNTYGEISNEAHGFLNANWEAFVDTLQPIQAIKAAQYLEKRIKLEVAIAMQDACQKKLSHDILLRGNEYVIRHNGVVNIFDNEHIPQELKMKLGMLKLVAVGESIDGIGYRGTEDCFIVV
jgi:hypothetical protein